MGQAVGGGLVIWRVPPLCPSRCCVPPSHERGVFLTSHPPGVVNWGTPLRVLARMAPPTQGRLPDPRPNGVCSEY